MFYFYLSKKIRLDFYVNPLPNRIHMKNQALFSLKKQWKKHLWMSSAAVVIGAFRVKYIYEKVSF